MKALSFLKSNIKDILIFLGLVSMGTGLFICFGPGWAGVGVGAILLLIGFFGR